MTQSDYSSWKITGLLVVLMAVCWIGSLALADDLPPPPATSRWPAQVDTAGGQVTIFKPQLTDFDNQTISCRVAVSVQAAQDQQPIFGSVWLKSNVATDQNARTVRILDVAITRTVFPSADQAAQQAVNDAINQVFTANPAVLSLDQVLSTLDTVHKAQAAAQQFQTAPPKIVFLDHPAVKLQYDGQPRLTQAQGSNLLRAVNTPFFVVLDPATRTYFLKGGGLWFSSPNPLGPFTQVYAVPQYVSDLANASGYQDPQQPLPPDQARGIQIFAATEPTELICTTGPAEMGTIAGTDLLYYTNTDSDVFLDIDSQQLFVLLSGRWFTGPNPNGPWAFVPPEQLPPDFARIPPDSEKADALASVPGAQAAQEASANAYVPTAAAVDTTQFDQPPVSYDGDPDFEPVAGTDMTYAVNTDSSVVYTGGVYYCCSNAVWYQSRVAVGPWAICTVVPSVIYTIPPSCPVYPIRFCYVYGHRGNLCYFGYLPGYVGCYVRGGVVIYGTGFYYRPWIGRVYYGRPATFGFAARFNISSGHWGFDFASRFGGGKFWIGDVAHRGADHRDAFFGYGGFRSARAVAARGEPLRDVYAGRRDVKREFARPARLEVERQPAPRRDTTVYRRAPGGNGLEARDQKNNWKQVQPREIKQRSAQAARDERAANQDQSRNNDRPRKDQPAPQEQPRQSRQDRPAATPPADSGQQRGGGGGGSSGGNGRSAGGAGGAANGGNRRDNGGNRNQQPPG